MYTLNIKQYKRERQMRKFVNFYYNYKDIALEFVGAIGCVAIAWVFFVLVTVTF